MFLQGDAKAIEWVCVNYLSQDPVGMEEIYAGIDQHAVNQRAFNLPDRRIAKIFVFRLIYGGSEWSYSLDPDFSWISSRPAFWHKRIDAFYDKYQGIRKQHDRWMVEATTTGRVTMPTGRYYPFGPYLNKKGESQWPRTKIINYPVQGLAADIVSIARVSFARRIDRDRCKLVSTVHDSIIVDLPPDDALLKQTTDIFHSVFDDLPGNFERIFDVPFNLPLRVEVKQGLNLRDMDEISLDKIK
ncbi:MAG: DNA polymerase [Candidatus Berkelbacteria bacterium]|nr:DNA polymerase [Candidatus Berkelbacteria bacterium]